jgi:hypothetical protein
MLPAFCIDQDGPITIHTFEVSSTAAVDAWRAAFMELLESTPPDQPFLALMDVSSRQVSFTRYARQTSLNLFTHYKDRKGRLAFLFTSKTAPHFARIFFASLDRIAFEKAYFSNRAQAIAWLREKAIG